MTQSNEFSLETSFSFKNLVNLLETRASMPKEERATSQPQFERNLAQHMNAFERELNTRDMCAMDVCVPGILVDGKRYRNKGKAVGEYYTRAGKITVERTVYAPRGGQGGNLVVPLEMIIGVVDGNWTRAAAELGSAFMSAVSSKEAAKLLKQADCMAPSPSHLDSLPKAVSTAIEPARVEFENQLRKLDVLPNQSDVFLISFSLDGVMVPMKNVSRNTDVESGPRRYREAACGTVCLLDKNGNRLHTIRLGRMPESKKVILHSQLQAELAEMVKRYPGVPVQIVADGADENWRIVDEIAQELGIEIHRTLDYYHALEHAVEALRIHAGDRPVQLRYDIKYWRSILADEPKGMQRLIKAIKYRALKAKGKKKEGN